MSTGDRLVPSAVPRVRTPARNPILVIVAECRRRRAMGERVMDLSLGEPEAETPRHIGAAAMRAITEGHTRYTPSTGLSQLRAALCRRLNDEGLSYVSREVMVTSGASAALFAAFQVLLIPGDEVLLPVPFYPAYVTQAALAGGVSVPVPTRQADGFKVAPEALRSAITPRSRVLVLNAPSNPAGVVYEPDELQGLATIALEAGLTIIADEVYADLVFGERPFQSVVAPGRDVRERTLCIRSLSKSYAMTGWRIGYVAGPERVIEAVAAVQEACLVAPCTVSQWAALEAIKGPQACVQELRAALEERTASAHRRLSRMPGVRSTPAQGGLFLFPDLGRGDTTSFCLQALRRHGVAVVPGGEFGVPSAVRISCTAPLAEIEEGLERLAAALAEN